MATFLLSFVLLFLISAVSVGAPVLLLGVVRKKLLRSGSGVADTFVESPAPTASRDRVEAAGWTSWEMPEFRYPVVPVSPARIGVSADRSRDQLQLFETPTGQDDVSAAKLLFGIKERHPRLFWGTVMKELSASAGADEGGVRHFFPGVLRRPKTQDLHGLITLFTSHSPSSIAAYREAIDEVGKVTGQAPLDAISGDLSGRLWRRWAEPNVVEQPARPRQKVSTLGD